MVNYGDLQIADRIMVACRSEMSAEWKVRFAIWPREIEQLEFPNTSGKICWYIVCTPIK